MQLGLSVSKLLDWYDNQMVFTFVGLYHYHSIIYLENGNLDSGCQSSSNLNRTSPSKMSLTYAL